MLALIVTFNNNNKYFYKYVSYYLNINLPLINEIDDACVLFGDLDDDFIIRNKKT